MSIKSVILKTGAFLFLACPFLMPSMRTQATVKKMDILNGDSRKSCQVDLDGDGVKEKLKMAVKYDAYDCIKNASVYVNGKKALVIKPPFDYSVRADYIRMSDSDIFVRIQTLGASDVSGSDYFYRYDPSRMKLVKETKLLEKNQYKSISGDLSLYKDTAMNNLSYRVQKDDILTLKKIKYTKDEWFVQFEKGGKKGWLGLSGLGSRELFYGVSSRMVG